MFAKFKPQSVSTVVLFAVILLASVTIAITTDINPVARGAIAIVLGLIAAIVTHIVLTRRTKGSNEKE